MSKFFDETQKAQEWAAQQAATKSLNLEQALRTVKENVAQAAAVVNEMADSRLGNCRKLHLTRQAGVPVILPGDAPNSPAAESYRTIRTRLMRYQRENGVRSLVVSSALPDEGKTLTALNLALCCAQLQDLRILLVDADLRTRGLTGIIGYPPVPGLAEVLAGKAQFDQAIFATDQPNLYILPAGAPKAPAPELYAGERWKELIGWCSEAFSIILVDTPPILPLSDFDLIMNGCDAALVVVRSQKTPRELLQKAAGQIDKSKLLGVIFNATDFASGNRYYQYYESRNGNGQ